VSNIAIHVEKLSKRYYIGGLQQRHSTLRDRLADATMAPFRRANRLLRGQASGAAELNEIMWALKDVSFEVECGEVVGIIGPNGAGKSTLLKVLSRITEPTEGYADVYGRVSALLEVGTGFHQELTGRENVYLNGAILGMKRAEIERKFDEIVAFAEVERFIDTPVKHYSSGMRLRLAFAVAAHLEPETMIVDEVLAVGDARFQKKCLAKMQDVGEGGRTVLFVSHNMPAITRLCQRAILLNGGQIVEDGPAPEVVSSYLNAGRGTTAGREWLDPDTAPAGKVARLRAVRTRSEEGQVSETIDIRKPVSVEMEYDVLEPGYVLLPNFHFVNEEGLNLFSSVGLDPEWRRRPRPRGRYLSRVWIPGNLLAEGTIFVGASVMTLDPNIVQFRFPDAVAFQVIDSLDGDSARGDWVGRMRGLVRPLLEWDTRFSSDELDATEMMTREAESSREIGG
jgi:lipopolysaccharide transport system ATP-binding protein